jgi:hypothetical protein
MLMSFDSKQPWISSDGSFVLFLSTGTDLVAGVDSNANADAYCRDLQSGTNLLSGGTNRMNRCFCVMSPPTKRATPCPARS